VLEALQKRDLNALKASLQLPAAYGPPLLSPLCLPASALTCCEPSFRVTSKRGAGGRTALMLLALTPDSSSSAAAASSFPLAAATALLAAGGSVGDLTAQDGQHQTALHLALKERQHKLAKLFLQSTTSSSSASSVSSSASVRAQAMADDFGRLPLHWAAQAYAYPSYFFFVFRCLTLAYFDVMQRLR
jgi:ankyrin repeat protein